MVLKDVERISPVFRGVPESVFENDINCGVIYGLSGRSVLAYAINSDSVDISDADESSEFYFNARFEEEGILKLDIKNRGYNGDPLQRHPDIYPKDLFKKSIEFFQRHGRKIQVIKGHWIDEGEYSDNYRAFRSYLEKLQRKVTREDKKRAALSTWTGQRVQELGFTRVKALLDQDDVVIVYFAKS